MKVGLCLGGGGSRGYAHIGVIQALIENGINIDIVNGTSFGAVIGGMYALHPDVKEMVASIRQAAESVNVNHFNIFKYMQGDDSILRSVLNYAICDMALLRKSMQSHRNNRKALKIIFGDSRFADTKIPFSAVATDIIKGQTVVIRKGRLIDGILASVSIPGIFPPVERGKRLLVDGYVKANIPVNEIIREGADFVISVGLGYKPDIDYSNGMDLINYIGHLRQKRIEKWALANSDFHIRLDMTGFESNKFDDYEKAVKKGYLSTKRIIPQLERKLEEANG